MKFVSKSSNLMVVLKPGFPGNHLTGTAPVTGVYVKFQNGTVDVKEDALVEMMKKHPAFNMDFIAVEEGVKEEDPYAYYRSENEPTHIISEVKYGQLEKSVSSSKAKPLHPDLQKVIRNEATKMAVEMVKEMLPNLIKEALASIPEKSDKKEGTNVKIDGKVKKGDIKKDESEAPTE